MERKSSIWVNFTIRIIFCMALIFFGNELFAYKGIALQVGFNGISLLASGVLGVPGVIMLYGISALSFL